MSDDAVKATPLAQWSVIDLFGRTKAAGFLTEVKHGGKDFLRLAIPATNGQQARTVDYNPDAVYAIEAVDEETARMVAALDRPPEPVNTWSARRMVRSSGNQLAITPPEEDDDDQDDYPHGADPL